jgi:hypothetical protein
MNGGKCRAGRTSPARSSPWFVSVREVRIAADWRSVRACLALPAWKLDKHLGCTAFDGVQMRIRSGGPVTAPGKLIDLIASAAL